MKAAIFWTKQLQYSFWGEVVKIFLGRENWLYLKFALFPDEYQELMTDLIQTYCMGGEL